MPRTNGGRSTRAATRPADRPVPTIGTADRHNDAMADTHESSTAAWAAVVVALVGFAVGGLGLVLGPNWLLFWVGLGLVVVAPVVGLVLGAAGLGAGRDSPDPADLPTSPRS